MNDRFFVNLVCKFFFHHTHDSNCDGQTEKSTFLGANLKFNLKIRIFFSYSIRDIFLSDATAVSIRMYIIFAAFVACLNRFAKSYITLGGCWEPLSTMSGLFDVIYLLVGWLPKRSLGMAHNRNYGDTEWWLNSSLSRNWSPEKSLLTIKQRRRVEMIF